MVSGEQKDTVWCPREVVCGEKKEQGLVSNRSHVSTLTLLLVFNRVDVWTQVLNTE